ncbi:Small-conductance mechanosensitive channel [Planctomycetes bacterium Pan216]|uniref:Small-conductance mechanosensitive channel n=1 Tax=Kolteria novifilia TaxID=2527975 RepID=A0A518B6Z1_9BACT|nr:Small-conductance mechanosensitive channel [Planctomycetes bacterium Pan216]
MSNVWTWIALGLIVLGGGLLTPALVMAQENPTETPTSEKTPGKEAVDGEGVALGRVDVEASAEDPDISARLLRILDATGWFNRPEVNVDSGVVFLQGSTSRDQYKQWATSLAQKTEGVTAVVNRVEVVPRPIWDFTPAFDQLRSLWRGAVQSIPLVIAGVLILVLSVVATRATTTLARVVLRRRMSNRLLSDVLARAIGIPVFLIGLYVVLHVAGLTRLALTVLGGTGVAGLVIGIAFRDIAENFLASLLISVQNPFRVGDLIKINDHLGIVEKVTVRGTLLMAFDGTYIQIPNATIYKNVILNLSANSRSRLDFTLALGYDVPINRAQEVAIEALRGHEAVVDEPAPMILAESLGSAAVGLRVYFWIDSTTYAPPKVLSSVIRRVKNAFVRQGIALADEEREIVFPDGVPVRMVSERHAEEVVHDGHGEKNEPVAESDEIATTGEGDLGSEQTQMRTQVEHSRQPEEGTNLLDS